MSCRHAQAELMKLLLINSSSECKADGSERLAAAALVRQQQGGPWS